jgi:DNA-binding XRE family transcriptional regulator
MFFMMAPMEAINDADGAGESPKREMSPLPLPVSRALLKLGEDLNRARRRRRMTQQSVAERIGASLTTVKRLEAGDPRVPLHFLARVLHLFGELQRLKDLLDSGLDDIGLNLMDEQLPKRIRAPRKPASNAL